MLLPLRLALAVLLLCGACSNAFQATDEIRKLRVHFPVQAPHVLGHVAPTAPEPRLDPPWMAAQALRPIPAPASLAGPLTLALPTVGGQDLRFELAGLSFRVRELSATGPVTTSGAASVYARAGGSSFWTSTPERHEEWLLLELDKSDRNNPEAIVAEWQVTGAKLRMRGTDVDLLDRDDNAKVSVRAPVAFASGKTLTPRLSVSGDRIRLALDGREVGAGPVLVDPYWQLTGAMTQARSFFTAALLPNGKVLVAGGEYYVSPNRTHTPTAELYDPATSTWSPAKSMSTPRGRHTMTTMADGKLLVIGGYKGDFNQPWLPGDVLASAELYDPVTDTWSTVASMATPRVFHVAALLPDGRVLVAGGATDYFVKLGSVEIYDPATNTWAAAPPMAILRIDFTATLLSTGKVLVAGGEYNTQAGRGSQLFDPVSNTWSPAAPMAFSRIGHSANLLPNGKVLIGGGSLNSECELYDPVNDLWTSGGAMATGRGYYSSSLLQNGDVVAVGGPYFTSAERYSFATNTWREVGSTAFIHAYHTGTTLLDGGVLVAGGYNGFYLNAAELLDVTLGTACTSGSQCLSGFCVDGLCCMTACAESCARCDAPGKLGTCVSIPMGSPGDPQCAPPYLCNGTSLTCPTTSCGIYDEICIPGYYCGGPCLKKKALGALCAAPNQCESNFCSYGVCCTSTCRDPCDICNAQGSVGTCTHRPAGNPGSPPCTSYFCSGQSSTCPTKCLKDTDCTGGHCADGVCCNTECGGACDTCNLPETVGFCSPHRAGFAGSPTCAPYNCNGQDATCPSACLSDGDCVSGHCVDGVCCDSACKGSCEVCDLPGRRGTCSPRAAGAVGLPSCAPYLCSGDAGSCPSVCAIDSECGAGNYCLAGLCVPRGANGVGCTEARQCGSGLCVDGYCCNQDCLANCDACNVPGQLGTCTAVAPGAVGSPSCAPFVCTGAVYCPTICIVDAVCAAGQRCVDGTCRPKDALGHSCIAATQCASGNCADGVCCDSPCEGSCAACSASGVCARAPVGSPGTPSCAPYLCGVGDCATGCVGNSECSTGNVCDAGVCVGPASTADGGAPVPVVPTGCGCSSGVDLGALAMFCLFAAAGRRRGSCACSSPASP